MWKTYNQVQLEDFTRQEKYIWKKKLQEQYSCIPGFLAESTYGNFEVSTFPAQVIGKNRFIEQHLTKSKCLSNIDPELNIGQ